MLGSKQFNNSNGIVSVVFRKLLVYARNPAFFVSRKLRWAIVISACKYFANWSALFSSQDIRVFWLLSPSLTDDQTVDISQLCFAVFGDLNKAVKITIDKCLLTLMAGIKSLIKWLSLSPRFDLLTESLLPECQLSALFVYWTTFLI